MTKVQAEFAPSGSAWPSVSAPSPRSDAQRTTFRSARRVSSRLWNAIQVELQGDYPVDHIKEFEAYVARTSWLRAFAVCALTPVPAILLVLIVDAMPLEDPVSHSAETSPRVWLRLCFTAFVGSACVLEQFRQHVPSLHVPRRSMPWISVLGAVTASGSGLLLARTFGYPFPFTMNVVTLPWFSVVIGLMLFVGRDHLRRNPTLLSNLMRHQLVAACQISLTIIYPLYNAAFVRLTAWEQTALVFVLPIIKLLAKNWISRFLLNTDEARPESVVFNVEVFHALFVSFSMQSSTAVHTVLALMAVDFIQAWLSFADITEVLDKLEPVAKKMPHALTNLMWLANRVVEVEPFHTQLRGRNNSISQWIKSVRERVSSMRRLVSTNKIHAIRPPSHQDGGTLTGDGAFDIPAIVDDKALPEELLGLSVAERGVLVRSTQKLLFVTEFTALVEYTEVVIPFIFNMYILIMFFLPNQRYYDFLQGMSTDKLGPQMANVFLYAVLELVSLVAMCVLLWRRLRLSLVHQIAFVLETRQASVQSKVLIWVTVVMQNAIRQFGVDYSFQFAWLRANAPLRRPTL